MSKTPDAPWKRPSSIASEMKLEIEDPIITMYCNKMARDGYLQKSSSHLQLFSIKFEGIDFIESGGYKKHHKSIKWNDWPKKNWIVYDIGRIVITALLTFILMRVCTLPKDRQEYKKEASSIQDTLSKK
jgi:hypothetical protein